MFVFAFRSTLAKIEPFLNPSLFLIQTASASRSQLPFSAMTEKRDERLAKLYLFLEDGEWKVECMGVVLIRADGVKLMWKRDT